MLNPRPTNVMWWPKICINAEVWGRKEHQSDSTLYFTQLPDYICLESSVEPFHYQISLAGPCSWDVFCQSWWVSQRRVSRILRCEAVQPVWLGVCHSIYAGNRAEHILAVAAFRSYSKPFYFVILSAWIFKGFIKFKARRTIRSSHSISSIPQAIASSYSSIKLNKA